jgi:hypothetical protein
MSNPRFFELLRKRKDLQKRRQREFFDESFKVIRFEIDGHWTVEDMRLFLTSVEDLYNLKFLLQISHFENFTSEDFYQMDFLLERMDFPYKFFKHPEEFAEFLFLLQSTTPASKLATFETLQEHINLLQPNEKLKVRRINYASPGLTDLAGLGSIVGHLKDFLQFVIKEGKHWTSSREEQNLKNEEQKLKNDEQRIKNTREFITVVKEAREIGMPELEIRKLVNWVEEKEDTIAQLVSEDKIKDVLLLESGE